MQTSRREFWWGAFGALAGEIVRFYKIFVLEVIPVPHFSRLYFLISFAFVLCGGFFAVAWDDDHKLRCLYVGLSFVSIISAFQK